MLQLYSSVTFENSTITENWFKFNIPNVTLFIDCSRVTSIEANAFAEFSPLHYLGIGNAKKEIFQKGSLNGVNQLTDLYLETINYPIIFESMLDFTNLESFGITTIQSGCISYTITLLTSYVNKSSIKSLYFQINLRDALSATALDGFVQLQNLFLRSCNISVIDKNAFQSVQNTLRFIDLTDNHLKQLPMEIIVFLSSNREIVAYFHDNPWHCDCNISQFQKYVQLLPAWYAQSSIRCMSPYHLKNVDLINADVCIEFKLDTISVECLKWDNSSTKINIVRGNILNNITRNKSYSEALVNLSVTNHDYLIIEITKGLNQNDLNVKCHNIISIETSLMHLHMDTVYLFCLMNKYAKTVTPFDCVSLYLTDVQNTTIWIPVRVKIETIAYLVLILFFCNISGLFLGYMFVYKYPKLLCNTAIIIVPGVTTENKFNSRYFLIIISVCIFIYFL